MSEESWFRVRKRGKEADADSPDDESNRRRGRGRREPSGDQALGWAMVGWAAFAFAVVGGADVVLAWYPPAVGNPEWEFGTVSQTLDALPLLSLGVVLLVGSGVVRGQRWLVRTGAVILSLMALAVVAADVLYAMSVPIALNSVPENVIRTGLKKAIVKATIQGVTYPVIYTIVAVLAFRHAKRKT